MEPAVFFDGRSSRRRAVTLAFADRVEIADAASAGSLLAVWPYDSIRRADGPEDALRLASTAAPPLARLELRDPMARAEMLRRCAAAPPSTAPAAPPRSQSGASSSPRSPPPPRSSRWCGSACRLSPIG